MSVLAAVPTQNAAETSRYSRAGNGAPDTDARGPGNGPLGDDLPGKAVTGGARR